MQPTQKRPSGNKNTYRAPSSPQKGRGQKPRMQRNLNAPADPGRFLTPAEEKQLQEELRRRELAAQARAEGAIREAEPTIRTVKSRQKKPFPVMILLFCLICSVFGLYLIFNSVKLSEARRANLQLQNEIRQLNEKREELQLELDQKNDLLLIEEYALKYGMVRADQLTRYYISMTGEDEIVIYEKEK